MKISTGQIKLDSFLKLVNAVSSGGEAKLLIGEGAVSVNGEREVRRGRKLRPGDAVRINGRNYIVEGAAADERG